MGSCGYHVGTCHCHVKNIPTCFTCQCSDQFKPAKPAKQSSDLRMNFSLWLIAVVIATINAVPLSEIEDQDYATELPNISDIEPLESDIESVTKVVVLDD